MTTAKITTQTRHIRMTKPEATCQIKVQKAQMIRNMRPTKQMKAIIKTSHRMRNILQILILIQKKKVIGLQLKT